MKKIFLLSLLIAATFMAYSQTKILLSIGAQTMTASLVDNAATRELQELLEKGPIIIGQLTWTGMPVAWKMQAPMASSSGFSTFISFSSGVERSRL